jgi:hypothetical protein
MPRPDFTGGGVTTPRQHDIIEKISGRRPICRARYISKCCSGPVDVYHGAFSGTGANWSVSVVRVCALCGRECEGHYPAGTSPEGAL